MLNIGDGDFAPGLTYVAISRVKSLTIVRGELNTVRARREDIEQRAESEQHVLVALTYSLYERSE